jgi:hypothetical protein
MEGEVVVMLGARASWVVGRAYDVWAVVFAS